MDRYFVSSNDIKYILIDKARQVLYDDLPDFLTTSKLKLSTFSFSSLVSLSSSVFTQAKNYILKYTWDYIFNILKWYEEGPS